MILIVIDNLVFKVNYVEGMKLIVEMRRMNFMKI